jgi:CRP-like cAMP-binding protein
MATATVDDLAGVALFDVLDDEARSTIAPWFDVEEISANMKLVGEGCPGYTFFVLQDGSARVTIEGVEVRTLSSGDFFGELALLGDGMRTATVTTTSPSRVLVLFGTEFRLLQQDYPELSERIESGLRAIAQVA